MIRVEHIGAATLYHGDCRDVLPTISDESVDMIFTDPPYGHGNHDGDFNARLNEHRGLEDKPIANDTPETMRAIVDFALTQAARLLKEDCCCCCCCCCGGGPRPTFAWLAERMDRSGLAFFHSVIWDKRNPGLGWRYRRQHEMVMVAHRTGGKVLWANEKIAAPNIMHAFPPRDRVHPNEKPLALVAQFIELHAKPGNVVLDPFMGSGTTAVAALQRGCRFIGVECDAEHFETAVARVKATKAEPSLFSGAA